MKVLTTGLLLILVSPFSMADIFEPFSTSNLNPFIQIYGLPSAAPANLTEAGRFSVQLQTGFSNNFTTHTRGLEAISIDGESHRANLSLRYGVTDHWEVGIDIPYVRHEGGSLDGFIEQWHDIWGLPNGGREDFAQDQLVFRYRLDGIEEVNLVRPASGIGDVRLVAGYKLKETENRTWSLRGGIKLPTGDPDDLTGSGGTDVYASIHLSDSNLFRHPNWYFHGNVGVLAPGNSDVLGGQLEDYVVFGSGAVVWGPWQRVSLKAQLDFHSAFYDSDLKELGEFSAQLVMGGSIGLGPKLQLDISLAEDILTDTSPDVVFLLGLKSVF